jgi:DNA-binding transcriptional MerR regulator
MNTSELSRETGVPISTLKLWVRHGHLRPAATGLGTGDRHESDETNVAQVRAL